MSTEPYLPNRQSTRWKGFDYAGGATYFVTICVLGRRPIFGRVENDEMHLSPVGQIVGHVMVESVAMRAEIELVAHVVMPNHLHVLVTIIPPMIGIPAIAATPLDVGAHGRASVES